MQKGYDFVKGKFSKDKAALHLSWTSFIDITQRMEQYFYALKALKGIRGNNVKGIFANVGLKLSNIILNVYIKHKKQSVFSKKSIKKQNLIVSFTSFPARINNVYLVVDSLIRQDILPEKVVLYLSKLQFPNQYEDLPLKLKLYISDFFEVRWVDEDLRPHKKYLYAFHDFPKKDIITVDDDSYYQRDMVSRLVLMNRKFPNAVCANCVHNIAINANKVLPYRYWGKNFVYSNKPDLLYLAVGVGGVLYPAGIFDGSDLFNKEKIKKCSLNTDDLWLKAHEILNNIPVVTNKCYATPVGITDSQMITLASTNVDLSSDRSQNDINWNEIDKEYNINNVLLNHILKKQTKTQNTN